MIPRYAPTYTYKDLFYCLNDKSRDKLEEDLISRLAHLFQVKYVFLTKTARSGIYVILKAYNHPGKVLIPAYNCISVPHAIHYAGYQPEFVDIDLHTLNALPDTFANKITPDTTVVMPTHLFGIPCNLEEILRIFKQRNIFIIEDAAPALGAVYGQKNVGCFGDASVVSFGGRKVIWGEAGGAVLTNDERLANNIRALLSTETDRANKWFMLSKAIAYKTSTNPKLYGIISRAYGLLYEEQMYEIVPVKQNQPSGYLSNMPGYSCALLQLQLDRLEWNIDRRRKIANIYRDKLQNHDGWFLPTVPDTAQPSWIQFPLLCDDKHAFYMHMKSEGIDVSWTYRYSCAESFGDKNCPNTLQAAQKVIGLPTTPYLTDQQAELISSKALEYKTGTQ